MNGYFTGCGGWMVVGFNHNFRYKGAVYHVQTEDGGLKSPQVVTLLYLGGTILSSKKTSYADIAQEPGISVRVEALMKAQHKEMLRRLKDGEFDAIIETKAPGTISQASAPAASEPVPTAAPAAPEVPPTPAEPAKSPAASSAPETKEKPKAAENNLDDIILSYLLGDDK